MFFVVWTEDDIHIEPIVFDTELYDDLCRMVTKLYKSAIVPEVVGQVQLRTSCSRVDTLTMCCRTYSRHFKQAPVTFVKSRCGITVTNLSLDKWLGVTVKKVRVSGFTLHALN